MNLDMIEKTELIDKLIELTNKVVPSENLSKEINYKEISVILEEKEKLFWRVNSGIWEEIARYYKSLRWFNFFDKPFIERLFTKVDKSFIGFLDIDPEKDPCFRTELCFILTYYKNIFDFNKSYWELNGSILCFHHSWIEQEGKNSLNVIIINSIEYPELSELGDSVEEQYFLLQEEKKKIILHTIGSRTSEEIVGALI